MIMLGRSNVARGPSDVFESFLSQKELWSLSQDEQSPGCYLNPTLYNISGYEPLFAPFAISFHP